MSYMHISNLGAKCAEILAFKTCWVLEKLHGTSSNVSWNNGKLGFFSGGENYERFKALFNEEKLTQKFQEKFLENQSVIIYGEAYGGKQQGMSETYGKELRFTVFEVKIGDVFLSVPQAFDCAFNLGFEFVDFHESSTEIEELNRWRDLPSVQALRNGIVVPKPREGIVIHPPFECTLNNGARIIAKHKNELFAERKTKIVDPSRVVVMAEATAIAEEFVTAMRMRHVVDRLVCDRAAKEPSISDTGSIIKLMIEDVQREGAGEFVDSPEVRKAIGSAAAKLFKQFLQLQNEETAFEMGG